MNETHMVIAGNLQVKSNASQHTTLWPLLQMQFVFLETWVLHRQKTRSLQHVFLFIICKCHIIYGSIIFITLLGIQYRQDHLCVCVKMYVSDSNLYSATFMYLHLKHKVLNLSSVDIPHCAVLKKPIPHTGWGFTVMFIVIVFWISRFSVMKYVLLTTSL